ncbi:hypothetical protein [Priestia endophytica]|uniref:hypothetical protein n=1 Tax=Priestia endophytica TaxID=135735 RepID=UPI00227E7467|nr:hypothetical protein [Priestia endophytica]MCY8232492.1 hypothetical protein [Priestia endophytica]
MSFEDKLRSAGRTVNDAVNNATNGFENGLSHTFEESENILNGITDDIREKISENADGLAVMFRNSHPEADFDECVAMVTVGAAAYGASVGGPLGAAINAGGGVHAAHRACSRVFPG